MEPRGMTGCALRVERGHATEEELAAVTVVLLAVLARRTALAQKSDEDLVLAPRWRRQERRVASSGSQR